MEKKEVAVEAKLSSKAEIRYIDNLCEAVSSKKGSFLQGSPSSEDIGTLIDAAKVGDSGSLVVVNSFYSACFQEEFLHPKCKDLQEQIENFNPFLELEKKAIDGDKFARLNYWPELVPAAVAGLINIMTNEYEWSQRKQRGVGWLIGFSPDHTLTHNSQNPLPGDNPPEPVLSSPNRLKISPYIRGLHRSQMPPI